MALTEIEVPAKPQTLWERFSDVVASFGDKEALLCVDDESREVRLTYAELFDIAKGFSAGLARIGVRRGDRVALLCTSRTEWIVACFATMRLGATLVPVNTRLIASEIRFILHQSGARHLIMLDTFRKINYVTRMTEVTGEFATCGMGRLSSADLPELRNVVLVKRTGAVGLDPRFYDYGDLARTTSGDPAWELADALEAEAMPGDLGMIKYTSGSTGFPKGAELDQGGIARTALLITERLETLSSDRWFTAMPFFHVGGSVWSMLTALLRGSSLVVSEAHKPSVTVQLVERERCTIVYGVPAMIRDILAELRVRPADMSSVRMMSATVTALIEEVERRIPSVKLPINAFGSTETYGPFAVLGPSDSREKQLTTMGRPLPGNRIVVINPDTGLDLPPGVPGEALLGGGIMKGYWRFGTDDAQRSAIDKEGWFHSGDLVSVDTDGYVTWLGRYKAMLKIGGENVAAEEVENVILENSDVLDAVVVPVPDERLDQIARAVIELQSDATITEEGLRAWCTERLAPFKVPKEFEFVDVLPRTGSGKIDRARMQADAVARRPAAS